VSRRVIIAIAVVGVLALAAIGVAIGFAFDHNTAGPMGFGHYGFGVQRDFGHSGWFFPGMIIWWLVIVGLIVAGILLLWRRRDGVTAPHGGAPQWLDDWHRRQHGWQPAAPVVPISPAPQAPQAPVTEQTQLTQPLAAPPSEHAAASGPSQASQAEAPGAAPAPQAEQTAAPPAEPGTTEIPPETPPTPNGSADTGGGDSVEKPA
jgi:hypothetical protein